MSQGQRPVSGDAQGRVQRATREVTGVLAPGLDVLRLGRIARPEANLVASRRLLGQGRTPGTRTQDRNLQRHVQPALVRWPGVDTAASRDSQDAGVDQLIWPAAICCCWASNMAWKFTSVSSTGGKPARVHTSDTMARR